jgi:hypothetical protein
MGMDETITPARASRFHTLRPCMKPALPAILGPCCSAFCFVWLVLAWLVEVLTLPIRSWHDSKADHPCLYRGRTAGRFGAVASAGAGAAIALLSHLGSEIG